MGGSVRRWPELAQSCEERRHRRQRRCHAGESGTCPQDVEEKCMVDELPSLRHYQPELLLEHIRIMPGRCGAGGASGAWCGTLLYLLNVLSVVRALIRSRSTDPSIGDSDTLTSNLQTGRSGMQLALCQKSLVGRTALGRNS